MKISLDWLRDYVDLPRNLTPQEIAHDLTMSTVEVEKVIDLSTPLEHIAIGKVLSVEPHPNAGSLSIVDVDHGVTTSRVVCGASNLAQGMTVAFAREGAIVTDSKGEALTVGPTTIRGVESAGMICSAGECGLQDAFPGGETEILDLTMLDVPPGTALAEALGYDDFVLEIDNKSLTNRPDLWGHHGIAREFAALYERPLNNPPRVGALPGPGSLEIRIDAPDLCRRYSATKIEGVTATPSPLWLRTRLAKVGQRSINLLVDLTNYVMLTVGQPTHAFDAREVSNRIEIRRARMGERIVLLDDKKLDLDPEVLVIANHETPIALAGVMGGKLGIRQDTRAMWLEVANFEPIPLRRTARRFELRTESSTRFEKGIDADRVALAQQMFLALLTEAQPGSHAVEHVDAIAAPSTPITVHVPVTFLQRKLGVELPANSLRNLLLRLQFGCDIVDGVLHVTVPSWRATGDVSLPEDIVEEVARLYGYERLVFTPPVVRLEKPVIQPRSRMERRVREYLAFRAGMREIVSYPWVSPQALDAAAMSEIHTIGLANPPSPEARLAPSLIPNLLQSVATNLRHQQEFRIFEQARIFTPSEPLEPSDDREHLPEQPRHVAAAFVGDDAERLFLEAKAVVERMARVVHVSELSFSDTPRVGWADSRAQLAIMADGKPLGTIGVASARVRRKAGIRRTHVAIFEINIDALTPLPSRENSARPLPTYPEVEFDISMILARSVTWAEANEVALSAHEMVRGVNFVDQYVGEQVPAGQKSLTMRLRIGSDRGTLVREQIDEVANHVMTGLKDRLKAVIRMKNSEL